jgi:ATP-binding cassette subfamily A (ABC1) protein 3
MKVYKGQITALLGHNGAGKTTTMSILTGLFPPTSGSAYINGLNVMEDVDTIRLNLGICPQYNVLFDRLTVVEHLKFFARLKGVSEKKIKESISFILKQLNFEKFKNYKAYQLSGGNKRKLSVAIAFTGDPDVVLLDEPTSGMDHVSQIKTWDLLESKRASDKTIVITTHSLDDTERCDRVLIMVDGKLACSGRPSWLKKRYGVGYNLKVSLNAHGDPDGVQTIMKRHIRDCEPTTIGRDVQILLPLEKIECFSSLFKNLEGN